MMNLDHRKKRLKIRSQRRGIRELDILLGNFYESSIETLNEKETNNFESLLDVDDHAVFLWVSGRHKPPTEFKEIVRKIVLCNQENF